MVRQCQVCRKMDYLNPTLTFHRFPADGDRLKMWIKLLQFHDKVLPKKPEICSDHFRNEDFEYKSNGVKYLKKNAYPKPTNENSEPPPWSCFSEQGSCSSALPSPLDEEKENLQQQLDLLLERIPGQNPYDPKNMDDHSYCLPHEIETPDESYQHLADELKLDVNDIKYEVNLEEFKFENEDFSVKANMEDLAEDRKIEFYFIKEDTSEAETSTFPSLDKCGLDTDVSKFFSEDDNVRITDNTVNSTTNDSYNNGNDNNCNNNIQDGLHQSIDNLVDDCISVANIDRRTDNGVNIVGSCFDGQADIEGAENYGINDLIITDHEANVINNNSDCDDLFQVVRMNRMF